MSRFSDEQRKEIEKLVVPIVSWLRRYGHPHMSLRIDQVNAEIVEGIVGIPESVIESYLFKAREAAKGDNNEY